MGKEERDQVIKKTATNQRKTSERKRKWRQLIDETYTSPESHVENEDSTSRSKYLKLENKNNCQYPSCSSNHVVCGTTTILDFPNELLGHILLHLKGRDIGRVAATCTRFHDVIAQNHLWRCLFRNHFPSWKGKTRENLTSSNLPLLGSSWKQQYVLNYTKDIRYLFLSGGNSKKRLQRVISDTEAAYGFKKLSCSRDHIFALDYCNYLHVYRRERDQNTNEFMYQRVNWHKDFAKHVIDVTTDPRYDNTYRRYVYVLTQSEVMRNRRHQPNTRNSSSSCNGWNEDGNAITGDRIDVIDERNCRKVFNMTFDPEMRFVSMKLTSMSPHQNTLFILTDAGKVYSLNLHKSSLLNLGSAGMQVTLKSASKSLGEKVTSIETSAGLVGFLSESGKLYMTLQRKSDLNDIFGRDVRFKLYVPNHIEHLAKVVSCSIGDRHLGFIDEYNRAFMVGNNRHGQLGTGDRMDRCSPVQVLYNRKIRILHCSLNHSLAIVESDSRCVMLGTGCGNNGRLPGNARGSVDFVKIEVNVPWGARQIDVHKECIFTLSCYDTASQIEYKMQPAAHHVNMSSSLKSQQELLIDVKKATTLAEKARILERMIEKAMEQNIEKQKVSLSLRTSELKTKAINQSRLQEKKAEFSLSDDLSLIRGAAEQLRLTAEGAEIDEFILNER